MNSADKQWKCELDQRIISSRTTRRVTFVQYAGDFAEAELRLASAHPENYRSQRYTVELVQDLAKRHESITVVTGLTDIKYDVVLPSGVRAIGAGFSHTWDGSIIQRIIDYTSPTHVILRTPILGTLARLAAGKIPVLALLADSFQSRTLSGVAKRALTAYFLNRRAIQKVGNHGTSAAESLIDMGVDRNKVLAWDYPAEDSPSSYPVKAATQIKRLAYVGSVSELKGVGDIIRGISLLNQDGLRVSLDIVGSGSSDLMTSLASELNVRDQVNFIGPMPNNRVIQFMSVADAVVVPSRYDCPEGLPLTIYEAYCSRSPLIASDHPMFKNAVENEKSALTFRAGDYKDLADKVKRLHSDPALYTSLSSAGELAWQRIQLPLTWGNVIESWLAGQ